jgi:hypothetical protein
LKAPARPGLSFERDLLDRASHFSEPEIDRFVMAITTPAGAFRFSEKNEPIQPRYISQVREVNGIIQPVVLGTIPEFIPEPKPPQLPPDLVLPK